MAATNGSNFSGSRRMTNGTGFIPYSLTLPANRAGPGTGTWRRFTLTGTVLGASYTNAPAGSYSDTVTISVNP